MLAVKSEIGSESTITHLAHASMVLATLRLEARGLNEHAALGEEECRPTKLSSPCWMNGRRYLCQDLSPSHGYIPICQALGEVVFLDVEQYFVAKDTPAVECRRQIIKAAGVAGACYRAFQKRKDILAESVPLMEHLGQENFKFV